MNQLNEFLQKGDVSSFKRSALRRVERRMSNGGYDICDLSSLLSRSISCLASTLIHPGLFLFAMEKRGNLEIDARASEVVKIATSLSILNNDITDEINDLRCQDGLLQFDWAKIGLDLQTTQLERDLQSKQQLAIGNDLSDKAMKSFGVATELIKDIWPEAYQEMKLLISKVVWFSSNSFWSSSEPSTFGAIYVNPLPSWTVANFVETIIHETGHHALMISQARSQFLLNPDKMVTSPLRKDLRPLNGVLHATFVLSRMAEVMSRLGNMSLEYQDQCFQMAKLNTTRLRQGIDTLHHNAMFTDAGMTLFRNLEYSCDKHSSQFQ